MTKKQKKSLVKIIVSALLTLGMLLFLEEDIYRFTLLIPYLIVGHGVLKGAWSGIKKGQPFDENFLMAVATLGALALGETLEGCAVMLFYQTGELFEAVAVGKSRKNISALMDIRPDSANIMDEAGQLVSVAAEDVEVGSVIIVRPGERIAIDGVVVEGSSSLDTAALTGESLPRQVDVGDEALSGCINQQGLLKIRTTRHFDQSTASKILELVENASSRKSRSEKFISRFARVYTPAVCISALALALLPPLFLLVAGAEPAWSQWIYRALTFLVISCPCALVISIPLSFFAGLGGASSVGVLIKGSNYMEALAKVKHVVFDKTGTMTRGVFEVTKICPENCSESELLELAALAESFSEHPISRSLIAAFGAEPDREKVQDFTEIRGHGVKAVIGGRQVAVGNKRLMDSLSIVCTDPELPGTIVHAAADGQYMGYILISDRLKDGAAEAVKALRRCGVKNMVMLTGDSESAAKSVAAELGIDKVYSRLLPEDKLTRLEELLAAKSGGETLAFVGDGINDAPVLSRADVGIAMGALGSDAAIEASDVVLMDDDPRKLAKAVAISRKCMAIVYQNIVFSIGIKLICLVLGALGLAGMWLAIFADVGVMVLAVLNAIRALNVKKL